jgi:hypothetical protein
VEQGAHAIARVAGVLAPGTIVDLHDGLGRASWTPASPTGRQLRNRREAELSVLAAVMDAALATGLRLVTLSELVAAAR